MKISKEKYKEILEIQMIPYNENSRWFEESLSRINKLLNSSFDNNCKHNWIQIDSKNYYCNKCKKNRTRRFLKI